MSGVDEKVEMMMRDETKVEEEKGGGWGFTGMKQ